MIKRYLLLVSLVCFQHCSLAMQVQGADPPFTALVVTPGGKTILAASQRGVRQFELPSLKPVGEWWKELDAVNGIRFSASGKYLLLAGGSPAEKGEARLYGWPSLTLLRSFEGGEDLLLDACWAGELDEGDDLLSGRKIVSVGMDKKLRIFDASSGRQLLVREGHSRGVTSVVLLPGQQGLVTAGLDNSLRVWSGAGIAAGKLEVLRALDNHRGPVLDLALRPASGESLPMVLSVSEDATVRFWQPTIGRMVRFASLPTRPLVCDWLPGGKHAVVVGTDGRLRVIDPETVQVAWEADAIESWAYCLAVLPGGRFVAVGGRAGELVLVAIPDRFLADSVKKKEP